MDFSKLIGPAFAALLIGAIGGGIWYSHSNVRAEQDAAEQKQLEASRQISLPGLIGWEKEALFADPKVQAVPAAPHITVNVEKAGPRGTAQRFRPEAFGFRSPPR